MTFSVSYYDVNQSIVALKTDAIVKNHTPAELKTYLYGDQIGTTGLAYINDYIKPTKPPRVYSTLDQAVQALQTGQIDAIVIDTPTGQYMALVADHQQEGQVNRHPGRPVPEHRRALRAALRQGQPAGRLRQRRRSTR